MDILLITVAYLAIAALVAYGVEKRTRQILWQFPPEHPAWAVALGILWPATLPVAGIVALVIMAANFEDEDTPAA